MKEVFKVVHYMNMFMMYCMNSIRRKIDKSRALRVLDKDWYCRTYSDGNTVTVLQQCWDSARKKIKDVPTITIDATLCMISIGTPAH
jgi:hypothetical protein